MNEVTREVAGSNTLADSAGMLASIACAIHCAAMPLVIGYLPLLGLSWLADESFHQVMAIVCFLLAAAAFIPGLRRHGSLAPVTLGLVGVSVLTYAAYGMEEACCPTCDAAAAAAESIPEPQAQPALPVCADPHCTLCESAKPTEEPIVTTTLAATAAPAVAPTRVAARVAPFLTPLGGMLLVVGHVVNYRKNCGCCGSQCCVTAEESAAGDPR